MRASGGSPGGSPPPEVALLDEPIALEPLAIEASRRFFAEFPQDTERRGGTAFEWCVHDTKYLLAWAMEGRSHDRGQFFANLEWLAALLEARDYGRDRLARHLELTAAVVAEQLADPGRELADLMVEGSARLGDAVGVDSERRPTAFAYADALIRGDIAGARAIVDAACESMPVVSVYMDVLTPALVETGERWARGEITIAQEHLISAVTEAVAARLAPRLPRAPARGQRAIVSCVDGEYHCIGARFVADLLESDGWDTLVLGASTPIEGLVEMAQMPGVALVALSSTLTTNLDRAAATVDALRAADANVLVAVGGRAYAGSDAPAERVGADLYGGNAVEFVALLRAQFDG